MNRETESLGGTEGQEHFRPVIGILTQPVPPAKKDLFPYTSYLSEYNLEFIRMGGGTPVPIEYDLPEDKLYALLDSINGVFFTGGAVELINRQTGETSNYYKTAKKIWQYSKRLQDEQGVKFPLLGVCQGLQLLAYLVAEDRLGVLETLPMVNERVLVNWLSDPLESTLFSSFSERTLSAMEKDFQVMHFHSFAVTLDSIEKHPLIQENYDVLSYIVDPQSSKQVVNSIQAKNYPHYAVMFHSEFILIDYLNEKGTFNLEDNEQTRAICSSLARFLVEEAAQNEHRAEELP